MKTAALPFFMSLLPIAASGIEGIIWVIILIVWSVAQYVQKSRAAQQRPPIRPGQPPPQPIRPPTKVESELQDLLRELTGQAPLPRPDDDDLDEPVQPVPPPVVRQPAPRPQPLRQQPPSAPVSRGEPPSREKSISTLPAFAASVGDLSEGMGAAFLNSGKMPGMTLKMRSVSLRGVSYSGSANPGRSGMQSFKLSSLRNTATLRQMVIGRMILDKPKALESSSGF